MDFEEGRFPKKSSGSSLKNNKEEMAHQLQYPTNSQEKEFQNPDLQNGN
jgi:hypothetical protein